MANGLLALSPQITVKFACPCQFFTTSASKPNWAPTWGFGNFEVWFIPEKKNQLRIDATLQWALSQAPDYFDMFTIHILRNCYEKLVFA